MQENNQDAQITAFEEALFQAGQVGPDGITHAYPSIDMTRVGQSMHKLHDHVCINGKRVEVTRAGCDDRCIMISKNELEHLERALEIFSNTNEFGRMCSNIQQLLETAGVVYRPQSQ